MADTIDPMRRSANMARIKSRDTGPEVRLRSALHKLGLRFRLQRRDLPGKPDIVFPRQKVAVQVRGCFWHQHKDCRLADFPNPSWSIGSPSWKGMFAAMRRTTRPCGQWDGRSWSFGNANSLPRLTCPALLAASRRSYCHTGHRERPYRCWRAVAGRRRQRYADC